MAGGIAVNIKVTNAGELEAQLRGLHEELARRQRAAMHEAVVLLKDDARKAIHSPEGRAVRGISYQIEDSGESLRGLIQSRSAAARYSQRGRPEGKAPRRTRIARWLTRSGQEQSRSSAFLIARAIGRRGMEGHPIMEEVAAAKRGEVAALFREAIVRVLARKGGGGE